MKYKTTPISRPLRLAVLWLMIWQGALVRSIEIDPEDVGGRSLTVDPNANPVGTCEGQSVADCPQTCIRTLGEWIRCSFIGGYEPLRFLDAHPSTARTGRISQSHPTMTGGGGIPVQPHRVPDPVSRTTNGCVPSGVVTSEDDCAIKFDHEVHPSPHD